MSDKIQVIENFTLETPSGSVEELAKQVCAMKLAMGLFFRSFPDEHKQAHLSALESFNDEYMKELAEFLRQFLTEKTLSSTNTH